MGLASALAAVGQAQTIGAPSGQKAVLTVQGRGSQIYKCTKTGQVLKWTLVAPEAQLFIGDNVVGDAWSGTFLDVWRRDGSWKDAEDGVVAGHGQCSVASGAGLRRGGQGPDDHRDVYCAEQYHGRRSEGGRLRRGPCGRCVEGALLGDVYVLCTGEPDSPRIQWEKLVLRRICGLDAGRSEQRYRRSAGFLGGAGDLGLAAGGGGGLGIVGFVIVLVISLVTGHNFLGGLISGGSQGTQQAARARVESVWARSRGDADGPIRRERIADVKLISFVLDDVQKTWTGIFEETGKTYRHAKLVIYRGATYSGCGTAQAQTGPFYCPQDEKVYIDLSFWDELKRFGGDTGDFAQAYVIAHELGHHVQKLLGIEQKEQMLVRQNPGAKNEYFGRPGAAGGLLCRRLGSHHRAARLRPRRRYRRCAQGCRSRRRRPSTKYERPRVKPGKLDAWLQRPA